MRGQLLHGEGTRQNPTKTIHPVFAEGLPLYFKNIDGNPMPKKDSIIILRIEMYE